MLEGCDDFRSRALHAGRVDLKNEKIFFGLEEIGDESGEAVGLAENQAVTEGVPAGAGAQLSSLANSAQEKIDAHDVGLACLSGDFAKADIGGRVGGAEGEKMILKIMKLDDLAWFHVASGVSEFAENTHGWPWRKRWSAPFLSLQIFISIQWHPAAGRKSQPGACEISQNRGERVLAFAKTGSCVISW